MEENFIVSLVDHRSLGFIFIPYIIQKKENKEFHTIKDRVTVSKIKHYEHILIKPQKEVVKWIDEYNDSELLRLFSKKKMSSNDFVRSIDKVLLEKHIRPYIDRRLYKCVKHISEYSIPLYDKRLSESIFETDRIASFNRSAQTVFNFHKLDDGLHYYLTLRQNGNEMGLMHKEAIFLSGNPCSMVMDYHLYYFEDIDAKKLQPFFTKEYIKVEKSHIKKYLQTFVKNAIQQYKVKPVGFEIVEPDLLPQAIIAIEKDLNEKHVLLLSFTYGDTLKLNANSTSDNSVELIEEGEQFRFNKINRKYNLENEYSGYLLDMGLENSNNAYFFIPDSPGDISSLINWLNANEKELLEYGFTVEQKFMDVTYFTGKIKIHFKVHDDQNDWFDLHALVEFGEYKIPFIKLRKNILHSNPEYVLPNGEVAILPAEWFARYRDLFLFGEYQTDNLKLKKQHFTILESSVQHPDSKKLKKLLSIHSKGKNKIKVPHEVKATLRPYQEEGFKWMEMMRNHSLNVCLADDMGLGKTLQTITLIQHTLSNKAVKINSLPITSAKQLSIFDTVEQNLGPASITPPSLIIVPKSLIHNWANEIIKFIPNLKVFLYTGIQRERNTNNFDDYNIILTTYGIVRNEFEILKDYKFLYIVLDESQTIKNPESKTYKAVTELQSCHKLVLTGTPLENTLTDLWSQLNFLNRGILGNLSFFKKEFVIPIEKNNDEAQQQKLKKIISPFILRRTKKEVEKDLPDLNEQILFCDMSENQKQFYDQEKSKIRNLILENIEKNGINKSSIVVLQGLTKLRQLSNHPVLVEDNYDADSGKFDEIIRRLENLAAEKHKVLIFSSFVKYLELFATYFEEQEHNYSMLTGSTKDRERVIQQFLQSVDHPFFLISLKAGGVGLNLTAADYVFLLDPWWNPAVENQAISRAHRIGQTEKVFVYRFISKESIEEKIIRLQQKKSYLSEEFINSNNPLKALTEEDLKDLFE